jgi:hypothetical protein
LYAQHKRKNFKFEKDPSKDAESLRKELMGALGFARQELMHALSVRVRN